jgi:hypothetical protein
MPEPSHRILLVTPVWNDSPRLAVFGAGLARALAASALPVRWVIADDGSGGGEPARLEALRAEFAAVFPAVELHLAARHHGKGAIVREGWARDPQADWLAFVDADGSASPADLLRLIGTAVERGTTVLGVRKRTATTRVVETWWRALAHRLFLLAVRVMLGLECADPQCGLKVLKGAEYRRVAPVLREPGLAFDSELLAALAAVDARWAEVPISWIEKDGGKVRPLRDAWGMLGALWRVSRREW